jgi:hypothetical protein
VTASSRTTAGIAYDGAGPRGDLPVVLLHTGVADRRMRDPLWSALAVRACAGRGSPPPGRATTLAPGSAALGGTGEPVRAEHHVVL